MRKIKNTLIWKHKFKLLGLALFAYILSHISFSALFASIGNTSLPLYLISFLFSVPVIWIRALRWKMFAETRQKLPMTGLQAFRYYWIAVFWGAITPGKIGELLKIKYLNEMGMGWGESAAATITDRLIDLACLMLLFYFGVLFLSNEMIGNFSTLPYLIAAAVGVLMVIYFWRKQVVSILLGFIKKIFNRVNADKVEEQTRNFTGAIAAISFSTWFLTSAITLFSWLLYSVQLYLVALALGLEIPFVDFSLIMYIVTIVTLIPVSVEGIGTRDAMLVFLLGYYGVMREEAIALSMLILGFMLFNTLVGAGFYYFGSKTSTLKSSK